MKTIFLENHPDIGVLPTIALVIFFALFIGIIIWVMRLKKKDVERMANLPLDSDNTTKNGDQHGT